MTLGFYFMSFLTYLGINHALLGFIGVNDAWLTGQHAFLW